jgi:hypothetical protein
LKSLVVFAFREGIGWLRPDCVPPALGAAPDESCANARAPPRHKPIARNSLLVIKILQNLNFPLFAVISLADYISSCVSRK